MADPNTLRILEIDGGGERGYLSLCFLRKFVEQWGIDDGEIWRHFDVICGTSVGGMMALALAYGLPLQTLSDFLTLQGPYIFSLTSLTPSVRPNDISKVGLILTNTPFYQSSGPTEALYGAGLLKATLVNQFGTHTLQDLKTKVIIPSYENDTKTYVLFSNLSYPEFIGQNELITNVALATGAAPVYLPSLLMNGHEYIDGGVYQNNPAQFGLTLAKMIKPRANRSCVLSIGTGLGEMGFDPGNPNSIDPRVPPELIAFLSSRYTVGDPTATIKQIFGLFDIACTGGQESVAQALSLRARYTTDPLYYYRFQPDLDLTLNTELDNTDPAILTYYEDVANETFNSDIVSISTFIGHLTA